MRIVMVNWAGIAEGASTGGGVNGYCRQLALGLAARGHSVAWISSGQTYTSSAARGDLQPCEARRRDDHAGVQVYEIINSPVLAPGIFQFPDPTSEISSPDLEAEFSRLLRLLQPQIVHFHNIEGFSAGCIHAARSSGTKVLYSLHNYHSVCPQVYLMKHGHAPCTDFDNGHACEGCVTGWETRGTPRERRRRAGLPEVPPPPPDALWPRLAPKLLRVLHLPPVVRIHDQPAPWRPVREVRDCEPDTLPSASAPPPSIATPDQHTTPLSNDPVGEPPSHRPLNAYGARRRDMIAALSSCDRVLAVSEFVRKKFIALGVSDRAITTLQIGSRMSELAAEQPVFRAPPPPLSGRPVRLAFIGYNNRFKGLPMLLDTLELLPESVVINFHLSIWAKDIEQDQRRVYALSPRLGGLSVAGGYRYEDLPAMLCGQDAGIVPSIWWDNGPQTVMEFMACGLPVIGARAGGIPELIRDGEDGLLFAANDRTDLARVLTFIADQPTLLTRLRANVRSPKSMAAHVEEITTLYAGLLEVNQTPRPKSSSRRTH